jgi:hypothetical protein
VAISAEGDQISVCVVTQLASRAHVVDLETIGTAAVLASQPSLAHCCAYWSSGRPRARKSSSECIQPSLPSIRTFSHKSVSTTTPKPPASSMSPLELRKAQRRCLQPTEWRPGLSATLPWNLSSQLYSRAGPTVHRVSPRVGRRLCPRCRLCPRARLGIRSR